MSTSDRIELSVHDEMSRVISNLHISLGILYRGLMFLQKFKVPYCFAVRVAAAGKRRVWVYLFVM